MLLDNDAAQDNPLKQSLLANGFDVIAPCKDGKEINGEEKNGLAKQCAEINPDVVIMHAKSLSLGSLDHVSLFSTDLAKPVIIFTEDNDKEKIKRATKAGVSAYIVGDIASERLSPIIDAAMARFEETQLLKKTLDSVNEKLEERKVVEKAKGILMKQNGLDENQAYTTLRELAMQKSIKLAELSSQLIDASKLLIHKG